MTLARENQASFEEYLSNNPQAHPGIDLTVTVLTTGFWPSYKSFDLNLPAEMVGMDYSHFECDHLQVVQLFDGNFVFTFPFFNFRLNVWRFSESFIRLKQSTGSLHGFTL